MKWAFRTFVVSARSLTFYKATVKNTQLDIFIDFEFFIVPCRQT